MTGVLCHIVAPLLRRHLQILVCSAVIAIIGCSPSPPATPKVPSQVSASGGNKGSAEHIMSLVKILSDESRSDEDRYNAATQVIQGINFEGWSLPKEALPGLRSAFGDTQDVVGALAAAAVLKLEPDDEKALKVLVGRLQSLDPHARETSAEQLGFYRHQPSKVVPALSAALKDREDMVRLFAAQSLQHYGESASTAVAALVESLVDPNKEVRIRAAQTLGEIGKSAGSAIPTLDDIIKTDKEPDVIRAAKGALEKIRSASESRRD
jgi:HEAT repeat protein